MEGLESVNAREGETEGEIEGEKELNDGEGQATRECAGERDCSSAHSPDAVAAVGTMPLSTQARHLPVPALTSLANWFAEKHFLGTTKPQPGHSRPPHDLPCGVRAHALPVFNPATGSPESSSA